MCHGMWPVGLVIGGVAVVGLALDRQHPPGKLLRMAAVPVASSAAALVTPVGPGIVGAVLSSELPQSRLLLRVGAAATSLASTPSPCSSCSR